jgi:hypothetical protein
MVILLIFFPSRQFICHGAQPGYIWLDSKELFAANKT